MYVKNLRRKAFFCLSKEETQMILDADDTLKGEGTTPITADLEAYEKLLSDIRRIMEETEKA